MKLRGKKNKTRDMLERRDVIELHARDMLCNGSAWLGCVWILNLRQKVIDGTSTKSEIKTRRKIQNNIKL